MARFQNRKKKGKVALIILGVIIVALLIVALVQCLWNWLMPDIFGLKEINYWQALGLFILTKLLFGGKPGKRLGKRGGRCNEIQDEFEDLSEQERDRFRSEWKRRLQDKCGF